MASIMSIHRWPGRHEVAAAALALACGLSGWSATAQETAHEHLEPRVSASQFSLFLSAFEPSMDQRGILQVLFEDYTAALDDLAAATDARADAAGRREVNDAIVGSIRMDPEVLRRMRIEVLRVYQAAWPEVDQRFEQLIADSLSMLDEDRAGAAAMAVPALRRAVLLHPRARNGPGYEYAGDGVDLMTLVDAAAAPGAELAAIMNGEGEAATAARAALDRVRREYEAAMDTVLRETASAVRQESMNRRIARIQADPAAVRAAEERLLQLWRRQYDTNRAAVDRIAAMLGEVGGEVAREAWLARVDEACFPWLHRPDRPDRQVDWLDRQSLDLEVQKAVEQAYADFTARRQALRRSAIELMIRGRIEHQVILYPMMNSASITDPAQHRLFESLVRNSGEQATLARDAAAAIESALPDATRQALKRAVTER
jgi:hypothetical protein